MKSGKIFVTLAAVAILALLAAGGVLAFPPKGPNAQGGSPTVVSYQGRVMVGGSPYSGTGYFKFAIVNKAGNTSYWSNDGTSSGGGEPSSSIQIDVEGGLFNVLLGDTSLTNMTQPLSASVFSGTDRYLRVWFSTSGVGPFTLLGDQRISSVPFALQAEEAANADTLDGFDSSAFGDITAVHAGDGLTGGGTEGDVTLAVDFAGTGSATTVARSDHDHDAAYINDDAGEVGDADVPSGALSPDRISGTAWTSTNDGPDSGLDADMLDGQHGSYYQVRVSGACTVGSTIRAINADGTVVCQTDAPLNRPLAPSANTITTLDSAGDVGEWTSVTIGADGLGLISYYDATNWDLKVAHCNDVACTSATITTLDSEGEVGYYTSVTIGADGLGLISYYDATNWDLKVAHCNDVACTSATITTLDSEGHVGWHTSVTIGADGLGLISYYDYTNLDLKVAHCNNIACTSATITTLDSEGYVGYYTSVTIGADGLGLISYQDGGKGDLKVAHCNDVACTSATITTLDSEGHVGYYTSVTIGADGLGLISYYDYTNEDLKVAHCSNSFCVPYFRRR
jgi:cell shape-determining protein MreC